VVATKIREIREKFHKFSFQKQKKKRNLILWIDLELTKSSKTISRGNALDKHSLDLSD